MKKINLSKPYYQSFYRNNRLAWFGAMTFTLLSVPSMMLGSWLLGAVLDAAVTKDVKRLTYLSAAALGILLYNLITDIAMYRMKSLFIHRALTQYKAFAFRNITQKRISTFSYEKTGRYLSLLTNDVQSIEENYLNNSFLLIFYCLLFSGSVIMMLFYSPLLTVVTLLLCILPGILSVFLGKELIVREQAVSDANERFVSKLKDLLSGFAVIKSFKAEKAAEQLFCEVNTDAEQAKRKRRWCGGLMVSASQGCGFLMQFGVFIIGALLAVRGDIAIAAVIIFVNLCNALSEALDIVPELWGNRKAACALIEKLAAITAEHTDKQGENLLSEIKECIRFENVTFAYTPDTPILRNMNLCFEAGKKYALVGSTGCGKSTLLRLLMGNYKDYSGSITIDEKELQTICADSLYDLISLIDQHIFLFDDTVLHNITMFRSFSESEIKEAVARSGLTSLWKEKGAEYVCGENGSQLSGGERQRISIARCLLRNTPVLLVDEATSALDNQTAFEITDALLHLEGFTRIIVTHRLEQHLLTQYDEIIVLRDGEIYECGTFEQLMERQGYFYSLYQIQQGD